MPVSCLFHVHTKHSFDSLLSVRKILAHARALEIDLLIVTDHNTVQGSRDALERAPKGGPFTVVAAEYQSEKGDIIGLFLKEEIRSRRATEIVREIHAQGGLVVLPHPFKGHLLDDELLSGIDIVETHNARCTDSDNGQAAELAAKLNLPQIAGADAHCALELGAAINRFSSEVQDSDSGYRDVLLHAPREFATRRSPAFCKPYSQMVKAAKTRSPRLFAYQAKQFAGALLRGNQR